MHNMNVSRFFTFFFFFLSQPTPEIRPAAPLRNPISCFLGELFHNQIAGSFHHTSGAGLDIALRTLASAASFPGNVAFSHVVG